MPSDINIEGEAKTIDIDDKGPGVDITLPEEKKENENEAIIENVVESDNTSEKSDEQLDVRDDKNEGGEVKKEAVEARIDKQPDNSKEIEEYSDGVKKRIAKLTKKMREAERQKEEAIQYARRVTEERNELGKTATSLDKNYTQEMEGRISSSIAAAQSKLAIAREQGDAKAEVEALTSISQLGYEQGKLAEIKSRHAMQEKEAKARPVLPTQPNQPVPPPDPKAEDWASKNEWFGKDNAMTYTAFDLHRKITEEEGLDPQSDEYYVEIDKRIRLEFPHKFGKVEKQTSKPTQNVASATRSSKTGRKTVRLTSSQISIARKLGVPLEEYAKQLITKEV
jgi:hypothetical protein|tara:strand:+ start:322 stop:1335 length:1014 start_codon:yes stop_codon:yes gene_type:complete